MSIELPDRLHVDPATVLEPDHAMLYLPDPAGGWQLHPGMLTAYRDHIRDLAAFEADHQAQLAEIREGTRQAVEQLHELIVRREAREALMTAGADEGLIDGALALFLQEVPLRVTEDRDVVVADPGSVAGVRFAAAAWLTGSGIAWFDKKPRNDGDGAGEYTFRLRELLKTMRTAPARTFPHDSPDRFAPVEVWTWPRRPAGWGGFSVSLHPWVLSRDGFIGWSDASDLRRFARELVADLRQRPAARVWHGLHGQVGTREPVLVSAPTRCGFLVRRCIAEWWERADLGTIPEVDGTTTTVAGVLGFDPWEGTP